MKRSTTMNKKSILLAQTGLAMVFFLSGTGPAAAQAPAPVSLSSPSPASPAVSIDAPIPGNGAPAPAVTTQSSTTTQTTTVQAAPAIPGAPIVPAAASATPTTVPSPGTPVVVQQAPAATKADIAGQPSAAELAVVKNAATPVGGASGAPTNSGAKKDNGLRVTDILPTPANIRPLPKQYLVVKKEHNANDADARLMAARSALAQGNYQSALELFDGLYRKNPGDTRVAMGRAVALQKLGQTDEALEAYQVALRSNPHNIEALTNMLGLLKGKDAPTALKKLQQLRDLYPANADVTAQLGMVYGVAGDYPNALKYLNMADALKPGSPNVLYNKAVAYDHMGNTSEAAALYRQILLIASDGNLDQSFPLEIVRQRLANLR